jgi:far upstream element-binding protein
MEIFIVLQNNQQSNALPPATPGGVNANGDTVNSGIMHVPNDKIGLVIGKGGATIKDIQQRTQCHVKIPNVPDPMSNPPVRSCVLTGSETAQYMCRHEIESIMNGTKHVNQIGQVVNASYASVQQMPQQQGMMMQGQGMYGNAGMMAPNAAYGQQGMGYGAYGAQAQVGLYGQQSAYGQPQQQQQMQPQTVYGAPSSSTTAQPAVQPSPAVSTPALDTYYNDYWAYAALYGEGPARQYYGAWSPPAGTPPPLGVILPSVEAAAAAAAAATTGAPANATANATTTTTATVTPAAPDAGTAELADSSGRNDFAVASADGASAAAPSDAVEDPEAQQAAWEKVRDCPSFPPFSPTVSIPIYIYAPPKKRSV